MFLKSLLQKGSFYSLLILLFVSCGKPDYEVKKIFLDSSWSFTYKNRNYPAVVPGCIHTDLRHNMIIPDPFYGTLEDSLQWISERSWQYQTTFSKKDISSFRNAEIVFEGLDCVTEVYLNGKPFYHTDGSYKTDNMFREWIFPIAMDSLEEFNEITVIFLPTAIMEQEAARQLPYPLPETRALTRKAAYQSGWDWGPRLITCGIWRPVYIRSWNEFKINDMQIYQKEISGKSAVLDIVTKLDVSEDCTLYMEYYINDHLVRSKEKLNFEKGGHTIKEELKIENPALWFPNGMGEQNRYKITVKAHGITSDDMATHTVGLRHIELIRERDSIGEKFEFHVNGIPVFMKGTNWIPAESFPSSMTPEKYRNLLEACKESHMNMIRIWGGGIYEDDIFYELCDEMGILVWQDFMFAGAIYPDDDHFIHNITIEAREQVQRLRNHPSIALWCGNNEVKNAWEDWGWQKDYTPEQKKAISKSIHTIFNELLPDIVDEYDPATPYHPTSPLWGWGHPENFTEGDSHYWGVWWGEEPFEVWPAKTGRFMSEYGFQSYPEISTIKQFTPDDQLYLNSPSLKNHQKHARGMEIITKAMRQYFGTTEKPEDFVYLSQLVQAYGIGQAIEVHRMKRPYCMGTLYWQLNDCWPVASWSSIDYYGNKKALYFTGKEKFKDVIIGTQPLKNGTIPVHIISDKKDTVNGNLHIKVYVLRDGPETKYTIQEEKIIPVSVPPQESSLVCHFPFSDDEMNNKVIHIAFHTPDTLLAEKIHYPVYPKDLKLAFPDLQIKSHKEDDQYRIRIKSNTLAKGVMISTPDGIAGNYSDNYFDLLPDLEKEVIFTPFESNQDNISFTVRSYNQLQQLQK